ncbi:MAG: hypothetical protein AAF591_18255 [Verrucomicrobiota bacterium]
MKMSEYEENDGARFGVARVMMVVVLLVAVFVVLPSAMADEHEEEEWEDESEHEEPEYTMDQVLEFLEAKWPAGYELLDEIKREESAAEYVEAVEMAARVMEEYHAHAEVSEKAAEAFLSVMKLEMELDELWERVWEGEEDDGKLMKEIRELHGKIFDLQIGIDEEELSLLKREVKELEGMLADRRKNRDRIITEDVEEMLGEILEEREEDEEEEDEEDEEED